jgi:xanthine dehydrogenase small subunit
MASRKQKYRNYLLFYLNGRRVEVANSKAGWMLADFLRRELQLTGTKIVCAEGDCGACTVLRLFPLRDSEHMHFEPINSCITTLAQMDGSNLVTVEALASGHDRQALHPVQKAMVQCHGSQCGYCTPGFVMALAGLVEKKLTMGQVHRPLSARESKNALTGNLCRCTGYQPILDAAATIDLTSCEPLIQRYSSPEITQDLRKAGKVPVWIEEESFSFFAPSTLKEAADYLARNKDTRIIGAGTDLGVLANKKASPFSSLMSLHLVKSLYEIKKPSKNGKRLRVGGRVTIAELRRITKETVPELARFLDLFASPQIKNVATLAGNIVNASPIADTVPFLLVANTTVRLVSKRSERLVPLERFYLDYKKTALKADEILADIEFDLPEQDESLSLNKVSQRKDLDISAVTSAFRISWQDSSRTNIKEVRLAMGGVAGIPLRLSKTEKLLAGKPFSSASIKVAVETLSSEISPLSDLRGSASYRRIVAENLFSRFLSEASPEGIS